MPFDFPTIVPEADRPELERKNAALTEAAIKRWIKPWDRVKEGGKNANDLSGDIFEWLVAKYVKQKDVFMQWLEKCKPSLTAFRINQTEKEIREIGTFIETWSLELFQDRKHLTTYSEEEEIEACKEIREDVRLFTDGWVDEFMTWVAKNGLPKETLMSDGPVKIKAFWHPCDDGLAVIADALRNLREIKIAQIPAMLKYQSTYPSYVLAGILTSVGLRVLGRGLRETTRRWLQAHGYVADALEFNSRIGEILGNLQDWETRARAKFVESGANWVWPEDVSPGEFIGEILRKDYEDIQDAIASTEDYIRQLCAMVRANLESASGLVLPKREHIPDGLTVLGLGVFRAMITFLNWADRVCVTSAISGNYEIPGGADSLRRLTYELERALMPLWLKCEEHDRRFYREDPDPYTSFEKKGGIPREATGKIIEALVELELAKGTLSVHDATLSRKAIEALRAAIRIIDPANNRMSPNSLSPSIDIMSSALKESPLGNEDEEWVPGALIVELGYCASEGTLTKWAESNPAIRRPATEKDRERFKNPKLMYVYNKRLCYERSEGRGHVGN